MTLAIVLIAAWLVTLTGFVVAHVRRPELELPPPVDVDGPLSAFREQVHADMDRLRSEHDARIAAVRMEQARVMTVAGMEPKAGSAAAPLTLADLALPGRDLLRARIAARLKR